MLEEYDSFYVFKSQDTLNLNEAKSDPDKGWCAVMNRCVFYLCHALTTPIKGF